MKYSKRFKESVLRKVLPPENRSIPEVAREMGISDQTIYNWNVTNHNTDPSVIGILTPGSEQIINHELTPPCL